MAKVKRPPLSPLSLPVRIVKLHAKLAVAILVGVAVVFAVAPLTLQEGTRVLAGWDTGVVVYLVLTLCMMWRADVERIRRRASEQDEGAFFILLLSIVATFASLAAVVVSLGSAKQGGQGNAALHVALAFTTILLSWAFVHTIFSFHYAHEYYGERGDGKIGGLHFPGDHAPDYRDFLYFSLVIGMTSQVSDVAITSKVIRRVASAHGVLSFFFNLVVLALTVNMVANLI
ncbi:MAG TPA: DUF1345 domain-containing protein [Pseudolabrys sp.]|jgi:uncharacterized membrane protein